MKFNKVIIKTIWLNPTGTKKKTVKISRKETQDVLSKLDVSLCFNVVNVICECT